MCKVMHLGIRQKSTYHIRDGSEVKELKETKEEKDLGVCVTPDLKSSTHCGRAASKASSALGLIRRNFRFIDKDSFLILYKSYIRPHLEYRYCVQSRSPNLIKDIIRLEQIQHRATKLVHGLRKYTYQE